MAETDGARIARMYRRDCAWALLALGTLWLAIAFVIQRVWVLEEDGGIRLALASGAVVLLMLNTASVLALLRHYTADKLHLYGLDIFYIDAMRAVKREARRVR